MNETKLIIFITLALLFFALAVRITFFYTPRCETFECFKEHMEICKEVRYINEEPEATWQYEILSLDDNECKIQVTMLQAKEGELGIERLRGMNMVCVFPKGVVTYPGSSIDNCHGVLKEELQAIIINKLHAYVLEKLGEIDESLYLLGQVELLPGNETG